jgi:radical SAM superfamily enzyme YgiQ (UPF0313 family)
MRVLLISANREETNMRTWPLGLACVAAATRQAGHEAEMLDLVDAKDPDSYVRETIRSFRPDIIGISVRNIDDQRMENTVFLLEQAKEVVEICKAVSDAPIVLGGAGYSMFPESVLQYLDVDMGIRGEGELAFPALLERIERGADLSGSPGLYLRGRGAQGDRIFVKRLDQFPLPTPDFLWPALQSDRELWLPVQTRRGCPMNCSYCSTASIEGCHIRKRSPEIVAQWLRQWAELGFHRFYFVDNTFNLPPSYAEELCPLLATISPRISWRCILYPARLDEDLIRSMARAGCVEVSVGFESGSELVLSGMNKRFNSEEVTQASKLLAENGISRMGFLMLGGPGETKESALASLAFADSLEFEALKISVGIRIYPQTALEAQAVREGVVAPVDDLLFPTFYVVRGLRDWLYEIVEDWMSKRPNWVS